MVPQHLLRITVLFVFPLLTLASATFTTDTSAADPWRVRDFSGWSTVWCTVKGCDGAYDEFLARRVNYDDLANKRCNQVNWGQERGDNKAIVICNADNNGPSWTDMGQHGTRAVIHFSEATLADPIWNGNAWAVFVYNRNTICHELGHAFGIDGEPPAALESDPTASCLSDDSQRYTPGWWDIQHMGG